MAINNGREGFSKTLLFKVDSVPTNNMVIKYHKQPAEAAEAAEAEHEHGLTR
jgi:hypothetical protein